MTLSTSKVAKFLTTGKVGLRASECSRHTHYNIRLGNGRSPLPSVVALSRSGGDLPPVAVHGIAKALGLRPNELQNSVQCNISGFCVHAAIVTLLIKNAMQQPHIFEPAAIAESAELLVDEILAALKGAGKCRSAERDLVERLRAEVGESTRYRALDKCLARLWSGFEQWQK